MRHIILLFAIMTLLSCGQNDTKQKELELKERELSLKEKELTIKEKSSNTTMDTVKKSVQQVQPTNDLATNGLTHSDKPPFTIDNFASVMST